MNYELILQSLTFSSNHSIDYPQHLHASVDSYCQSMQLVKNSKIDWLQLLKIPKDLDLYRLLHYCHLWLYFFTAFFVHTILYIYIASYITPIFYSAFLFAHFAFFLTSLLINRFHYYSYLYVIVVHKKKEHQGVVRLENDIVSSRSP